jgi:hypothetical protein
MVFTVYRPLKRLEPDGLLTRLLVALMTLYIDSSENITFSHSDAVQCLYFLQKRSLFFFIWLVSIGFRAATLLLIFRSFCRACCTVRSERAASSSTEVFN